MLLGIKNLEVKKALMIIDGLGSKSYLTLTKVSDVFAKDMLKDE
jgi:hypothetical protein